MRACEAGSEPSGDWTGIGWNAKSKLFFTLGLFKMSWARLLWPRAFDAPSRFTGTKAEDYNCYNKI